MKKILFILVAMFAFSATESHAQNIFDLLKSASQAKSDSTENSTGKVLGGLGDLVSGLLGKGEVNTNSLLGTWSYAKPAIVFESEDMLTNVGVMAAGKAAEEKVQTYLDKIGFTAGKVKITFSDGGKGTITYGTKNIPFQWSAEGCDLTINLSGSTLSKLTSSSKLSKYTSFKMNCSQGIGSLQLSFKADKLAEFITKIVSAAGKSSNSSTLNSVAGIVSKVDGMYLGLTLEK